MRPDDRRVPPTPARPAAPPRGRGLRGGDAALERHDRQDAGAGRAADRHGRRRRRRRASRATTASLLSVRGGGHNIAGTALADGGPDRRHVAAPRGPRRPRGADRDRAGRVPAGRRRPRDAAARAGHAARVHLRGRRRGIDARRRSGLPDPSVRVDGRQPARGRDRHRRRPRPAAPAATRTPTCSGRSAAPAPTSASSRRSRSVCTRSARPSTAG